MQIPGGRYQFRAPFEKPPHLYARFIIPPHVTFVGSPSPRKLRAASISMKLPTDIMYFASAISVRLGRYALT